MDTFEDYTDELIEEIALNGYDIYSYRNELLDVLENYMWPDRFQLITDKYIIILTHENIFIDNEDYLFHMFNYYVQLKGI